MTAAAAAAALAAAAAAGTTPAAGRGDAAFERLERLVAFGNRHAGAPRRAEAVGRLAAMLAEAGLAVSTQAFTAKDPKDGSDRPMVNIMGRFRPEKPCRFLLGSHFDTRHLAEEDPDPARRGSPIEGANDGSSGAAVLLAVAPRLPGLLPPSVGADIVLFDGEELGYPALGGYCAGSRRFAESLRAQAARPRFGIILDMVCAPGTAFKVEPLSLKAAPGLVDELWRAGAAAAPAAFSRARWPPIFDDHQPLSEAGVPSVLLIGFDDPAWHTSSDTIARCSRERLGVVAGVLEEFLKRRSRRFLKGGGCP